MEENKNNRRTNYFARRRKRGDGGEKRSGKCVGKHFHNLKSLVFFENWIQKKNCFATASAKEQIVHVAKSAIWNHLPAKNE